MAAARLTAHSGITPVTQFAAFAVPSLGVAQTGDALTGGDIAGPALAVAGLTAASQLQRVAIEAVIAHLTMVPCVTLRTLCANIFRMLNQLELGIEVHIVVALQLAAGREVVGFLRQGTRASLAVVWSSLQGIPIESKSTALAAAMTEVHIKRGETWINSAAHRCGGFSAHATRSVCVHAKVDGISIEIQPIDSKGVKLG